MQFTLKAELISLEPESFIGREGKEVNFHKAIFLSQGDLFEVNTTSKEVIELLKQNLRKEIDYKFKLEENTRYKNQFKITF